MNETKKVYEETCEVFRRHYNDENKAWGRFIDFLAVDHFPALFYQTDHKFKDIAENKEFIGRIREVYRPDILRRDKHDYLGDMYIERQGSKQVKRKGQVLTPEGLSDMVARMTIGEDITRRINVLDPCVGTGRMLMSAYRVNSNANLFGVDNDLNALRIAYVNFLIHGIKNFYLLHADSLRHETDISKPEGSYNWEFANSWKSHINKLKPIGHFDDGKQGEMALYK